MNSSVLYRVAFIVTNTSLFRNQQTKKSKLAISQRSIFAVWHGKFLVSRVSISAFFACACRFLNGSTRLYHFCSVDGHAYLNFWNKHACLQIFGNAFAHFFPHFFSLLLYRRYKTRMRMVKCWTLPIRCYRWPQSKCHRGEKHSLPLEAIELTVFASHVLIDIHNGKQSMQPTNSC